MANKSTKAKYVSKGLYPTVTSGVLKACRRDRMNGADRWMRQYDAFMKGKNVVLTIPNPNPNETAKRFIKVNAKDYWGDWRDRSRVIFGPSLTD